MWLKISAYTKPGGIVYAEKFTQIKNGKSQNLYLSPSWERCFTLSMTGATESGGIIAPVSESTKHQLLFMPALLFTLIQEADWQRLSVLSINAKAKPS